MQQLQQNKDLQNLLLNKQPVYTQIYNAGSSVLNNMCGGNYVAIGDAALTLDPISSHGMVMAMTSARDAVIAFNEWRHGKVDAFVAYNQTLQDVFKQYEKSKQKFMPAKRDLTIKRIGRKNKRSSICQLFFCCYPDLDFAQSNRILLL